MSTNAETSDAPQERESRVWTWGPVLVGALTVTLVQRLTVWPWWIVSATGAVIVAIILALEWAKRRRGKAAGASPG